MSVGRTAKLVAVALGIVLLLLVLAVAFRLWDNGRERVHSAEQAAAMAKAEAGPRVASLPMRIETEQDFWIVRFGPDAQGREHNYLVSVWDRRAGSVVEQTVIMDVDLNEPGPSGAR
jgi:hypothetical protein